MAHSSIVTLTLLYSYRDSWIIIYFSTPHSTPNVPKFTGTILYSLHSIPNIYNFKVPILYTLYPIYTTLKELYSTLCCQFIQLYSKELKIVNVRPKRIFKTFFNKRIFGTNIFKNDIYWPQLLEYLLTSTVGISINLNC